MTLFAFETRLVNTVQLVSGKLIRNQGVLCQHFDSGAVLFNCLQTVQEEKASFGLDGLPFNLKLVAAIVDLPDEFPHVKALEGCHSDEKLEQNHTERPRVDRISVALALQNLR